MAGADTIERLRQFLRELAPAARVLLIGELERSVLRGDDVAFADVTLQEMLLQELRLVVREQRGGGPRVGSAARLFFKPLEPFLVDDRADHSHSGRVTRLALESLWTWVRRDLLPDDGNILAEAASEALAAGDAAKAETINRTFQDRAAAAIEAFQETAATDEIVSRRMLAQVGTQHPAEDIATLKCALKGRDALADLAARLPLRIGILDDRRLDECKALVDGVSARDSELFPYALLVVMSRLSAPWQLIRFGIKAANSDIAARVVETPYGQTVTIALADLEQMVGELRNDLRSGGVAVGSLLKCIHDAARGLRTEMDLPMDSSWGRTLGSIRAQIAELLRSEINSAPGRVRRLLRARPFTEIRPNSVLDADEVAETEALIDFVSTCRTFANELAINEMTQRTFSELQRYLDNGTRALLDSLHHAGALDCSFRQSQVDAAARFCSKVFGPSYGSVLNKAAEMAAAPERKRALA
ncbi:MAG: hypothetical protein ABI830_04925 [Pseudolabrys sp.]